MNCNKLSLAGIAIDYDSTRCNRGRLDTGTFCNYDCEFCYYQGLLHIKTDIDQIKQRVDKLVEYGIDQVDLSGGESSVHKHWFDILDYCNDRFKHISTLSNGWAFSKESFLLKSKQRGLKEIMFSVHGYNESSHDEIVGRKGAWKRINKAIDLCHKHGIIVRVNCTVYQKNHDGLNVYHETINRIKPLEVNFLTLNYWTNNKHADPIDYKQVTNSIKRCIDRIKHTVKYINVRYTPYCYMVGYEEYVCNHFQHIYDLFDWNKEIYDYQLDTTKKYTHKQKINLAYREAARCRVDEYKKPKECMSCKYYFICDGVENQIKNVDVSPVEGEKIVDVNHYRTNFYEQRDLSP